MEPEQSPANETALELREHKDGVCEIYANFIDICWGLHDVRLRLARVIPTDGGYGSSQPLRVAVEQNAALTMPWGEAKLLRDILIDAVERYELTNWGEAKLLRDILIDAVERYELTNGELKWPKLATQNVKEFRQQQLLASAPVVKVN